MRPHQQTVPGDLSTRPIRFAHGDVDWRLSLPRSADELIDEAMFERDERLPYWADLWPSARALARHVLDHPPSGTCGCRVIELGCGAIALASLALAVQGFDVLATDYEDDAIASVQYNRDVNCAGASMMRSEVNAIGRLQTAVLDWRDLPLDIGRFNLIVGADLMYEQRNAVALADAVPRLLADDGSFLLADPGRRYLPEFIARMKQRGIGSRELEVRDEPNDDATKPSCRVRIMRLSRD